jgi:RsiW-degrading membrane proteinase PrsW (M82 family)
MIYQKDHEKEPLSLLIKCLFGGCLSVLLSLAMSIPLGTLGGVFQGNFMSSFHQSFLEAAIPEEIAKFAILYWGKFETKKRRHEPTDQSALAAQFARPQEQQSLDLSIRIESGPMRLLSFL